LTVISELRLAEKGMALKQMSSSPDGWRPMFRAVCHSSVNCRARWGVSVAMARLAC